MSDTKYGKTALIDDVTAATQGLTRKQVETVVNATLATIQQKLQTGQAVTLTGFGTFRTSERAARRGKDIRSGQPIQIAAHTAARWTPANNFMGTKSSRPSSGRARAAGQATTTQRGRNVPKR
jgi:nucleoid DNA-binding protein